MTIPRRHDFVLSLYATSRGFAFVLFEGPEAPYDWGVKDIRAKHKNEKTLEEIKKLIEWHQPEVIVIEAAGVKDSRRTGRIRKLYRMISHAAGAAHIEMYRYSRREVQACFSGAGAKTKYEIARVIADRIPALAHRMPRLRELWMSEDPRQGLFDAAAIGFAHYVTSNMQPSFISPE